MDAQKRGGCRITRMKRLCLSLAVCLAGLGATAPGAFAGASPGFWWGTDTNAPVPSGSWGTCPSSSVPYLEPSVTDSSGSCGKFGVYYGELAGYWDMSALQGTNCGNGTDQWNPTGVQDAYDNVTSGHNWGMGPGGFYFAAGPGMDPNYNGSTSEAYAWGQLEGRTAVNLYNDHPEIDSLFLPYVIDVEDSGGTGGWNETNDCHGHINSGNCCSPAVARATYNGIFDYIQSNIIPLAAVYSSRDIWTGIFGGSTGSGDVHGTEQWVAGWNQNCANYGPDGFEQTYASGSGCGGTADPGFFGGVDASSNCAVMWQWASTIQETRDFSEIDAQNVGNCN